MYYTEVPGTPVYIGYTGVPGTPVWHTGRGLQSITRLRLFRRWHSARLATIAAPLATAVLSTRFEIKERTATIAFGAELRLPCNGRA